MHKEAKSKTCGSAESRDAAYAVLYAQTTVPKLLGLSPHLEYKVGGRRSRESIEVLSPTQEQQFD